MIEQAKAAKKKWVQDKTKPEQAQQESHCCERPNKTESQKQAAAGRGSADSYSIVMYTNIIAIVVPLRRSWAEHGNTARSKLRGCTEVGFSLCLDQGGRETAHKGSLLRVVEEPHSLHSGRLEKMPRTAGYRTSLLAAALALLSASQQQQGVWALQQSKVAFAQHGLEEGEDAVMHAPSSSAGSGASSRLSTMTPQLLSSAIARVMSLDARAEVDTGLPAGDIFNRPDANVLLFVDGLRPAGTA